MEPIEWPNEHDEPPQRPIRVWRVGRTQNPRIMAILWAVAVAASAAFGVLAGAIYESAETGILAGVVVMMECTAVLGIIWTIERRRESKRAALRRAGRFTDTPPLDSWRPEGWDVEYDPAEPPPS